MATKIDKMAAKIKIVANIDTFKWYFNKIEAKDKAGISFSGDKVFLSHRENVIIT